MSLPAPRNEWVHSAKRRAGYATVGALEKILKIGGPGPYRFIAEKLHDGVNREGFEIDDIHFSAEPCSVGQTPQGELTGRAAAELLTERGRKNVDALDICCGVGIVGVTMLSVLRGTDTLSSMSFGDINIFNVSSLRKTLEHNQGPKLGNVPTSVFLTDALKGIPAGTKFDIIVSNPPHFLVESFNELTLGPEALGSLDAEWVFHKDFYAMADEYLKPGGEIWFLENGDGASDEVLRPFIDKNPRLKFIESFKEKRDPTFFWMITRLVS